MHSLTMPIESYDGSKASVQRGAPSNGCSIPSLMTRKFVVWVALACLGFLSQAGLDAQQSPPKHIRILTAGGLLGLDDGMPEYPGGPFDTEVGPGMHPYGGLAGLVDWVKNDTEPHDLFLMTANNLPRDVSTTGGASAISFFSRVRQLAPSAIAVGVEDFLRGLDGKRAAHPPRPPSAAKEDRPFVMRENKRTGGLLVTRMRDSGLPFVVSNAAVRLHQAGINRVASNGFSLAVDADSSIGWVRDIAVLYPCGQRTALKANGEVAVVRTDAGAGPLDRSAARSSLRVTDSGPCRATVSLPSRLRPGGTYSISVGINGATIATFSVRTDESLTTQPVIVPDRLELPIIVALVDPRVRTILGDEKWRWTNDEDAKCAADECEILLQSPVEAFDTVLGFAESSPSTRPVVLLSQLEDKDTSAILQHSPRVRMVVLPPDSLALGRAAVRTEPGGRGNAAGAGGPFSGDLGYGAVLNMGTPTVTQVWARPEWFGESIHSIEADVTVQNWEYTRAEHGAFSVKGRALCAKKEGNGVGYFLEHWRIVDGATVYTQDPESPAVGRAPYRYASMKPDVAYDAAGRFKQGPLWTSLDAFAAVALDAMRTGFNTDLAILPSGAIDENWLAYLRDDPHAPTQFLSRVLLERLLFRAGTIVKVRLPASSVLTTMNSIVTSGRTAGVKYCISGVNAATCGSPRLSAQTTLINERKLDRNRFYTIAMPESVALENNLTRYGADEDDLVYLMDRVFAAGTEDAADTCSTMVGPVVPAPRPRQSGPAADSLPAELERVRASVNHPYLYIKPTEFSFNETQVEEPADGLGLFNKLSVPNSGAKPSRRMSFSMGADIGIVDTRRWAVRLVSNVAYGRAVVNGQSSTDPNSSLVGVRADRKVSTRGRAFAGLFWETQFSDQVTRITPTSKGVTGPTLSLLTRRRDYRYFGAGFELESPQFTRWLSIDPLRFSTAVGTSAHEHVDIQIEGQSQGLLAFQRQGATTLLNNYFATHPGLNSASVYEFVDQALRRVRMQVDATPRFSVPFGGKSLEVSLAATYRRFVGPNAMPLAERQSAVMKLTIAIPLYGLATLNLNATESMSQVNGVDGWFRVWQPSVSVSIPVISSRHAGWVW